jgi:hypothetical protein
MLTPDGRVKLMDLGIARGIDGADITRASSILGTAGYVSPEQARGEPVDHRSDIYSLGCVLYEMLTGRQPFEADNPVAVAYRHVHDAPVPPTSLEPSVPAALEAVVLRAMEKDPAARFPTVADMSAALDDRTVSVPPVEATRPLPVAAAVQSTADAAGTKPTDAIPRRVDRPPPRRRTALVLLAVAALVLLGGLAFALLGGETPTGRRATPSRSPSPSVSPSPSATPSPTPSATAPPADPLRSAVAALQGIVSEGVNDGTISEKAAEEIQDKLDDALEKFDAGDTEGALKELEDLEKKVGELVDKDEIAHSEEQRLDRAIEDLAEAMFLAAPPSDGDDD